MIQLQADPELAVGSIANRCGWGSDGELESVESVPVPLTSSASQAGDESREHAYASSRARSGRAALVGLCLQMLQVLYEVLTTVAKARRAKAKRGGDGQLQPARTAVRSGVERRATHGAHRTKRARRKHKGKGEKEGERERDGKERCTTDKAARERQGEGKARERKREYFVLANRVCQRH